MASSNASVIMAILLVMGIVTLISTDIGNWAINLNCQAEITAQRMASSGYGISEQSNRTNTVPFGSHPFIGANYGPTTSQGFTQGVDITGQAVTGNAFNIYKLSPACSSAIAGSSFVIMLLGAMGIIIAVYIVAHMIPIIGIGAE